MKPIVHYTPSANDYIEVGKSANVYPTDHPSPLVSNQYIVYISRVIKITEDGFEIKNTKYVRI